jgi:signal transduction histidine kinase
MTQRSRPPVQLLLPVLITTVLGLVAAIAFLLLSVSLRRSAIELARERMGRATTQIAEVGASSVAARRDRYVAIIDDTIVRRALRGARISEATLRSILARVSVPEDSGMPVQLWNAERRRLAAYGSEVAPPELPLQPSNSDFLRMSPMYRDGNRAYMWFVIPVRERDRTIGFVAHYRRPTAGPVTLRIMQDLSGLPVTLYYRNADSSVWITATGELMTAPPSTGDLISEARMGGSPIVAGMRVPSAAVLERPNTVLRTVLVVIVVLVLTGSALAWRLARWFILPLNQLARAADKLGEGNYGARVPESGPREVGQLASRFNRMAAEIQSARQALETQRQRAELASKAKSEFLAVMSHELRTPLNAIGGYVDLLEMELRGPVTPEQRRDLERIKTSQRHLMGLISNVLDLARIEERTVLYDLTPVLAADALAEIEALVAPQAAQKGVRLEIERARIDVRVMADADKLRQILLNLLSNAIRHTPPEGRITVSVESSPGIVTIRVADTGPGIPPERMATIFEPFVQLDRSLSSQREGLGLGLSISRSLAEGMRGSLSADPKASVGAAFNLTLPAVQPTERMIDSPRAVQQTA